MVKLLLTAIFFTVLASVVCHFRHTHLKLAHHYDHGLPFLRNASEDAVRDFFSILHNENSTKAEIQSAKDGWAARQQKDVKEGYFEFEKQLGNYRKEFKDIVQKLEAIRNNMDITLLEECEQIHSAINATSDPVRMDLGFPPKRFDINPCSRRHEPHTDHRHHADYNHHRHRPDSMVDDTFSS
jgi:hypothetical protein